MAQSEGHWLDFLLKFIMSSFLIIVTWIIHVIKCECKQAFSSYKFLFYSVTSLKLAIERKTKVPASSLVLLVSGGEVLLSDHMVSSYSAGTDTNPIYMFIKPSVKESHLKQSSKFNIINIEFWRLQIGILMFM